MQYPFQLQQPQLRYPPRPGPEAPGPQGPETPGPEEPGPYVPTDEELARLAELGVVDEQTVENLRRQRAAEQAASAGPPEGYRPSYGTYVAASPLEHLASAGGRIAALARARRLRQEEQGLVEKKRAGYKGMYDVGFQAYGYPKPFQW